jgi:hypothetical protein
MAGEFHDTYAYLILMNIHCSLPIMYLKPGTVCLLLLCGKLSWVPKIFTTYIVIKLPQWFLNFMQLLCKESLHAYLLLFDLIILIKYIWQRGKSFGSFFHLPIILSLLGQNILITLFSNTLILSSCLNIRVQVSHPYKTNGKLILSHSSIFKF